MWLITVFTILSAINVHTLAFSWHRNDPSELFTGAEHSVPQDLLYSDIGLGKDAIDLVDVPYARKPDCFRRAAGRIRVKCAEIDLDADQRVKAAISMTLCELRTAEFHSIPLECEVFLEESGLSGHASHGICVEALSRSTQSWASYSGYLREIPQLCFAYQRSNEKDLALEVYRNATVEKIAYIRHLTQRAEREDEARALWQSLLLDLQSSISSLQASTGLADKIYVDISARVLHELQQAMRVQMKAFDAQLQESQEHSLAASENSRTLMSLTTEFERSFSTRLNSGLQVLDSRLGETLGTSDKMWQRFSLIEQGLLSSMNLISRLATSVSNLSDALNSSAHEVVLMNIAQENAVLVANGLIGTLQLMNETVVNALVDINATAIEVNRSMGVNFYSFYPTLLSLSGVIVLSLKQFSLLHLVASTVVRLLWSTLQHLPSFLIMPFAIATISVLRWVLPKILLRRFGYSRPYVCDLRSSLESKPNLAASVTLAAQATPWARRRPFGWRSSQFSRIPDRLCGRRLED